MKLGSLAAWACLSACSASATPDQRAREEYQAGNSCFERGLWSDAAAHYEAALAVRDRLKEACQKLAYCHEIRGDESRAVEALEKAVRIDPKDEYALRHLWRLYCRRGFPEQALGAAKALVVLYPDDRALKNEIARLSGLKGN